MVYFMNDKKIIDALGGTAVVARLLKKKYTTVHNWTTRGIPAKYKLQYPELFQRNLSQQKTPSDN